MNREYAGSFPATHGPDGEEEVYIDRSLGRIYIRDTEGHEIRITTRYLEHGWSQVARVLEEYLQIPKHRLIEHGLPAFFRRRPVVKPKLKFNRI